MDQTAQRAKRKYDSMLRRRDGMKAMFRSVSKYVLYRTAWFGDSNAPNRVVSKSIKDVYDDTAIDCAKAAAAAFVGALWPNAEESFELVPHPLMGVAGWKERLGAQDVKTYYKDATLRSRTPFNSAEAGFTIAFAEHMREQVVLGTSGIVFDEDEKNDAEPCFFRSISVETSVIDENERNRVDCIAFEYWYTARQVVDKYGEDKVSKATRDLASVPENEDTPVKVIQLIQPRRGGKAGEPKKEKPFASIHFEAAEQHTLLDDGMDVNCAYVVRFERRPGELYGDSLAMGAMPTIREQNVTRMSFNRALGKQLDPPVGFWTEMFGGAGSIDLSAGAKVQLFDNGSIPQGRRPVEQFMEVPEPRVASERITANEERMMIKFMLDKLLDFNNKTRMTLGEAQIRTDFRNQALGPFFSRQMVELLYPLIMRVVGMLWRRGMMGLRPKADADIIEAKKLKGEPVWVMPEVVEEFYEATGQLPFFPRFCSPAARAMQADAQMGLEKLSNFVIALIGGGLTDAADSFDTDRAIELYQYHVGAPQEVVRAAEDRDAARQARQQAQAQMAQLEMQEQSSQIAKNAAKAAKDSAQAGIAPGGLLSA